MDELDLFQFIHQLLHREVLADVFPTHHFADPGVDDERNEIRLENITINVTDRNGNLINAESLVDPNGTAFYLGDQPVSTMEVIGGNIVYSIMGVFLEPGEPPLIVGDAEGIGPGEVMPEGMIRISVRVAEGVLMERIETDETLPR